jgi:hypothetical protein
VTGTDRERWQRVTDLFSRALEQEPGARAAWVHRECGGDPRLAADVLSLLRAHDRASSGEFLDRPAAALVPDLLEDDSAEFIGRRIGPYVIRAQIGRGGMGVVFEAEDTRLGRSVALKAVPRELAQNERSRERLRREARLAASLSHPAIATVYALEESAESGELFIASEFVSGRTLRDELAAGPLPRETLLSTARAVAGALAEAHARGIVHRDLKPENVVRRDDGQIKVLDFGLAQAIRPSSETVAKLTMTGAVVGTPGYMAPEQLRGEMADARADVFAFGVLLFELATGRHPFGGGDAGAMLTALLEGHTPLPDSPIVSGEIDAVVRRCLRTRADERFSDGAAVLAALNAVERGGDAAAASGSALWWWEFHQIAISVFHSAVLVALWLLRGLFPAPWGNVLFYAGLAAETIAVTMRLHLWFSSRLERDLLRWQRRRVSRPVAALDLLFGSILLAFALRSAHLDQPHAPLLVAGALVSLLSLLVIEPATTRAAFRSSNS